MDKLTINELKGYLGTGLQMRHNYTKARHDGEKKLRLWVMELTFTSISMAIRNQDRKPILYPLSSLTEYREDLGFVPIDNIKESQRHLFFREDLENPINGLDYSEIQKLFDWHFDCFNLIDRNLAINIKTLKDE